MRIGPGLVAAAVAAALCACSVTVGGAGHGRLLPATATSTVPARPPTTAPTTAPAPSASSASSTGIVTTSQPHICAERCRTVARAGLGNGYTVELDAKPGPSPTSVLVLRQDGQLRTAGWFDDERAGELDCASTPTPNCVVVDGVGMHAAIAYGVAFEDGALYLYGHVSTDTPVIVAKDLDRNGWLDVIAEVSTERPSYATGPRYWATYVSDGQHLTGTGCTTPTMRPQPEPTIVITGDCAPA